MSIDKTSFAKIQLFLVATFWLSFEYIFLGPFSYFRFHDTFDGAIVSYILKAKNFLEYGYRGNIWLPNLMGGVDSSIIFFDYKEVIFTFFPNFIGYQILVVLHFFFAGYGTYLICKNHLELDNFCSIFSGILFMLFMSSFITDYYGYSFFPIFLVLIDKCFQNISQKKTIFYIIIVALLYSFFSPHSYVLAFNLPLIFLWFLLVRKKYDIKSVILILSLFSFVAISWQIQEIFALTSNASFSHRNTTYAVQDFIVKDLRHIFISGEEFNGLIMILLLVPALIISSFKDRKLNTISILLLCFSVLSGVTMILRHIFEDHIGIIRGITFTRFNLNVPFLTAIGCVYLFNYLKQQHYMTIQPLRWIKYSIYELTCLLGIVLLIMFSFYFKLGHASLWLDGRGFYRHFENPNLKKLSLEMHDELFRVGTIASFGLEPSIPAYYGLETTGGNVTLYPQRYLDFFAKIIGPWIKKYDVDIKNSMERLYLRPKDLTEKIKFNENFNLDLLSLANAKYIISHQELLDDHLIPILRPAVFYRGDGTLFVKSPTDFASFSEKIWQRVLEYFSAKNRFFIYENKKVLPRFFIVSDARYFSNNEILLNELAKTPSSSLKKSVFIENKYEGEFRLKNKVSSDYKINLIEYKPQKIILDLKLDGDGILVISNSYNPFWKAKTDKGERKIIPVNHSFWGISVDKTDKQVVFYYDPPY